MAQFLVRNSLNPYKVIKIGISFSKFVNKTDYTGDELWVVELGTEEPSKAGGKIPPTYLNNITLENMDDEISKAVSIISEQVDWDNVLEDDLPPHVTKTSPSTYIVSIDSSVRFDLKEFMPSSGIDKDSIKVTVNDIDVTNDIIIDGNPYEYIVNWYPRQRIRSTY